MVATNFLGFCTVAFELIWMVIIWQKIKNRFCLMMERLWWFLIS